MQPDIPFQRPCQAAAINQIEGNLEMELIRKRTVAGALVGLASAALLVMGVAYPAQASTATEASTATITAGQSASASFVDAKCVAAQPNPADAGVCTYTTTVTLGTPQTVTKADVLADKGLTTSQKSELLSTASPAGTLAVSSNHWSQFATGAAYTQTQNGRFYYNGSRVWVTQTYLGYNGSQTCFTNYFVPPWSISNVVKSDSGSTTARYLYCGWNVNQFGLFTSSFSMEATVHTNGTISGFGATVG